jgi:multidrug efflux pump subunit AcrA (membrane-fusion protein)
VEGRIVRKAEVARAGSYVSQGALLVEIDPRDYDLEVRRLKQDLIQAESGLAELKVELTNTEALIELAEEDLAIQTEELERLRPLKSDDVITASNFDQTRRLQLTAQTSLLTLKNQLRLKNTGLARLEGVRNRVLVQLEKAELDLTRTKVAAPVSGVVVQDSVEEDSYVRKGDSMVTIEDTSRVEVRCNLRMEELAWLWQSVASDRGERPTTDAQQRAADYQVPEARATVVYRLSGRSYRWEGMLSRYEGIGLDETTRTVPCRVVVDTPETAQDEGPPALVRGMFVTVLIQVEPRAGLLAVPSRAVRPGGKIWRVKDGKLQILDANVVQALGGEALGDRMLVRAHPPGIAAGDAVVTTPLPAAQDGMAVRESSDP